MYFPKKTKSSLPNDLNTVPKTFDGNQNVEIQKMTETFYPTP